MTMRLLSTKYGAFTIDESGELVFTAPGAPSIRITDDDIADYEVLRRKIGLSKKQWYLLWPKLWAFSHR